MAKPARILALNLGSHTIGLAEFRLDAAGALVLHGFRRREVAIESGAETNRPAQATAALREMLEGLQCAPGKVNYAIANQNVFARFVKLPPVEAEKIERIIQFEAQQNVPFPIDEVVWDYQIVGGGGEEQLQVVLVAIKADLLEELNRSVETAGLTTNLVDVATMALYNAFFHNYADASGCSLLIDLGARTTNLLFIEPGHVFTRSIAQGGHAISTAIARELEEPFAAAEFRKKREGFVSLGAAYEEPADPEAARTSKVVRGVMTRLHGEIVRSINHYRAQQQGAAPQQIFLAGGSASLPYLREFLQEKLSAPVEFFNPLRRVAVANPELAREAAASAHSLGELVGLALRSVTRCPMELNLAPASVERARQLERRRPFYLLAAACFLLGLLGWSFWCFRANQVERAALDRVQSKVTALSAIDARMETVRRETGLLERAADPLFTAIRDRDFWPRIIEDLNTHLPKENIWITELVATSGGKPVGLGATQRSAARPANAASAPTLALHPGAPNESKIDGLFVRGLYLFNPKQQEVAVDYFRNLVRSKYFKIDPKNQARTLKPSTPDSVSWAYPYELRLELRQPIAIP